MLKAIKIENLNKSYGKNKVLNNVNLNIEIGEFYCLLGPNGSGKTTLSSIIAGIRSADSGNVTILGKNINEVKEFMGYIPQENFSDPNLSGKENLLYFAKMLGKEKKGRKELIEDIIRKIGLEKDADKRVSKYSGGMKKRLELATILFPGIDIMILDEPTTGLDPSARRNFFSYISKIKKETTTIFLISHIGSDAELATKVGLIDEGKIIVEDSPEKLKQTSGLKNTVIIETLIKNEDIKNTLSGFSCDGEVVEVDIGYRIFTEESAEIIPKIVRNLESSGNKVLKISASNPSIEDVFFKLTGKTVKEVED
jgi:ABC-2 type transport system ATP-binding protein